MGSLDRRLAWLEKEVCDGFAIGWPECEGDRIVAYHLEGKRLDRRDDEGVSAFEQRVLDSATAKYTILLSRSDAEL